jgi:hypothetical protein
VTETDLADRIFRLNPAYRFVGRSRLQPKALRALGLDRLDPGYAGVLVPAAPDLPVKAVCARSAALLRGLLRPGPLRSAARRSLRSDPGALPLLVLDSVLELACGNRFVTGAAATHMLALDPAPAAAPTRIGRLSIDALRYAQELPVTSARALSDRLYFYNRAPASPAWAARLPTRDDVAHFIGIGAGETCSKLLASDWVATDAGAHCDWLAWHARARLRVVAPYKVYVSVDIADLPDAFALAVAVASEHGVPGFKIGCDLYGLQRPDKLVLYVATLRDLKRLCARLLIGLRGARPQGTPFTAAIDRAGLISWGLDPVPDAGTSSESVTSWRRSITDRLALALLAARSAGRGALAVEPWQFALQRLRLDGVDPRAWTPAASNQQTPAHARD